MNAQELKKILFLHELWIYGSPEGVRADLHYEDLRDADLYNANLYNANLSGANLGNANLSGANLSNANLHKANLCYANLHDANLSNVDLSYAGLYGASLCYANLSCARLSYANLSYAKLYRTDLSDAYIYKTDFYCADISEMDLSNKNICYPLACPEEGSFVGWKKANNKIIKLLIPEDAKRSSSASRKCRCDKAIALAIQNMDGTASELNNVSSDYDGDFIYEIGKTVYEPEFDTNRWNECAPGIHFFITRQEAVDY